MRIRAAIFPLLPLLVAACHDDKPKTTDEPAASASSEAIPSDLVYNSFIEDNAPKAPVATSDGGAAAPETGSSTLDAPGADPKSTLRYAFSTKSRTVDATLTASGGPPGSPAQPPIHFAFTATPKLKSMMGKDATIDVKITKFDIKLPADAPPELAAGEAKLEKALVGVTGHFDVTQFGEIGDVAFDTDQLPPGAANVAGVIQQAFALIVVPLPNEPVGVGAKWEKVDSKRMADQGASVSMKTTITLLSRDAHTVTLKVENTSSGSIAVSDPRAPKGTTVEVKSNESYNVVARLDGVAEKVDGTGTVQRTQKVPGQPDQSLNVQQNLTLTSK